MKRLLRIIRILLVVALFTTAPVLCAHWLDLRLVPFVIVWDVAFLFIIAGTTPGPLKPAPKQSPIFPWWGF